MMHEAVLTNAHLVLPDRVVHGAVLVRDGVIADVSETPTRAGQDLGGDHLIPGIVELHTDHLENHYAPRASVRWEPIAAVMAHDGQIATAGITTVFDAIRVGTDEDADLKAEDMRRLADAIEQGVAEDRLRADHYIHLRCEVSAPDCMSGFGVFREDGRVRLVSLMDHAPGQRQYADLATYTYYYQRSLKLSGEAFRAFMERRIAESETHSQANRQTIAAWCHPRGIVLASHDDATDHHVDEAMRDGVRVAEFPTTMAAAEASRAAGMGVLMGAPNLIRGRSHSGNVSARSLAEAGMLDVLSSDYIPCSLVHAVFRLPDLVPSISLPEAVAMVTRTPADLVGLLDRGSIEADRRADLVRVRADHDVPQVVSVWRQGRRVA